MKRSLVLIIVFVGIFLILFFGGLYFWLRGSGDYVCSVSSDCELPMDYAIRSNCPFDSLCIGGSCRVVCPMSYHDPNFSVSKSYYYACEFDVDCNCSERGSKSLSCKCVENRCVSVEE